MVVTWRISGDDGSSGVLGVGYLRSQGSLGHCQVLRPGGGHYWSLRSLHHLGASPDLLRIHNVGIRTQGQRLVTDQLVTVERTHAVHEGVPHIVTLALHHGVAGVSCE